MTSIIQNYNDVFTLAIILVGIVLAIIDIRYVLLKKDTTWKILTIVCAFIGIYWAVVYSIVLFLPGATAGWVGPVLVRPGVLITLASMVMNAIARHAKL